MVKFERRDPFPLLKTFTKSEALSHAADCDQWLGLRIDEIESRLASAGSGRPAPSSSGSVQQLWFGLAPRDLQTPYLELRALLNSLGSPRTVVDLGAAYARIAFVIERHFSATSFIGFEYVGERVLEARAALARFGAMRSRIEHADLTSASVKIPAADVYFIYDYGTPSAIEKTLHDVRRVSAGREILIVARGRVCRYAIESRHSFWLGKRDPSAGESTVTVYQSRLHLDRIEAPVENYV
jgi:hypothetical protein